MGYAGELICLFGILCVHMWQRDIYVVKIAKVSHNSAQHFAFQPQTRGAKYLYDNFLKDFLKTSSSKIDNAVQKAKENVAERKKDE
jgi:hypothetical protein